MQNRTKKIVAIIFIVLILIFVGLMIYFEIKDIKRIPESTTIKDYISMSFKNIRIIFPLNFSTNSTG